ncbi:MAG: glycosyltransferase family 2 protein [bacterium]|nr:glycosyltransferase family 2 protein [bacterium]
MINEKLVSIGVPTYQGGQRIAAALDSLLGQTYPHIEIIVSDNASSDNTPSICRAYGDTYPRIRFFRQKENTGRINNFLFVLAQAKGAYFMWAGDDDTWEPQFLETLVRGLDSHPDHGVSLSSYRRFNEDGLDECVLFQGAQNLTGMSYAKVYKKMVTHEPIHVFISGLWRMSVVRTLFGRPIPETIAWDRIMMTEAALMTHFYSAEPVLFHKYVNPVSVKSRYGKDPEQDRHIVLFAYIRYLGALLKRVMLSPFVPLYRKFYAPFPWLGVWWLRRKRIIGVFLRDVRRLWNRNKMR